MGVRQILQLEGNVSVPGLQPLDISQAEIAVANIDGLAYWPGLYSWDVNEQKTGFTDRVTDVPCMPLGTVNVSGAFGNFADGQPAYNLTSDAMALVKDGFVTSGSFTAAAVVGAEIGMGSKTAGTGFWFLASLAGKIRYKIGNTERATYDSYTGPLLTNNKMTAVVFIYDRAAGQMILRVNGVQVDVLAAEALKTAEIKNELVFGRTNAGTAQGRFGAYRSCIGFTKALQGAELAALETMLLESVL
jgi:hypothetical protein